MKRIRLAAQGEASHQLMSRSPKIWSIVFVSAPAFLLGREAAEEQTDMIKAAGAGYLLSGDKRCTSGMPGSG